LVPPRRFKIPATHPALAGHFPNDPVVPGVVLLSIIAEILAEHGDYRIMGAPVVKFLAPLAPETYCELEFMAMGQDHLKFFCTSAGRAIASGTLTVSRDTTPTL
jgi:3-hydroxyacyl-[acyl-carrier-protein] dehydratase